jgi:uncharacterized protein YqcC (DUF446 family)
VRYDQRISTLLWDIEAEMRESGLWREHPPDEDALASTAPFAIDRLAFPEWLQWLFLPRMRAVLERGQPLAERCQILPAAEVYFSEFSRPCSRLLELLAELDRLMPAPHAE